MTQAGWMFEVAALVAALSLAGLLSYLYRPVLGDQTRKISVAVVLAGMVAGLLSLPWFGGGEPHPIAFLGLSALAAFIASIAPRSFGARLVPVSIFAVIWTLLVFLPVTVWLPDVAASATGSADGFLDHGGALSVLVSAGSAALGVSVTEGRKPRATPLVPVVTSRSFAGTVAACAATAVVGIAGLVSLEFALDDYTMTIAVNATVVVVATFASWFGMDRIRGVAFSRWRSIAAVIAGVAAATPAATLLAPLSALVLGALVGVCVSIALKERTASRPASRFAFVVHAYPAALGLVLLGLVAEHRGAIFTGQPGILLAQTLAPLIAIVYSAVISALLWLVLRRASPRV